MRKGGHETVPALFLLHLSGHNSEYYSLMYFLAVDERRKCLHKEFVMCFA